MAVVCLGSVLTKSNVIDSKSPLPEVDVFELVWLYSYLEQLN